MIRNKHDIPQGYGFPLSQAPRSRKNGALFYEQNQAMFIFNKMGVFQVLKGQKEYGFKQ